MTHSYVWHDSFIRVTRLNYSCDVTHSYMRHDAFIRVVWLIYTVHSYVWCKGLINVKWCFFLKSQTALWNNNNTTQHTSTRCYTLQYTATHCNTLQHNTTYFDTLLHTATHCNTLQHTATHCNTLQHTATQHNILRHVATRTLLIEFWCQQQKRLQHDYSTLQHTATQCNTQQHNKHTATQNATHCNTHCINITLAPGAKRKVMLSPLLTTTIAKSASICHEYNEIESVTNGKQKNKNDRPCSHHCLQLHSKVGVDLSRINHNRICHERGTRATRKVMLSPLLTITICKVGVDLSRMKRDRIYHEWKKRETKSLALANAL